MKRTWQLLLPDWSEYDTLWQSDRPFALWPIGNQPLISYWLDQAVSEEIDQITIYTADRPNEIRDYLQDGAFWSRPVSVVPIRNDEDAPFEAIPVVGLPNANKLPKPIEGEAGLIQQWLRLNNKWLDDLDDHSLKIEVKHSSGGWIGPHVSIHPKAKLVPPFWIQGKCKIGSEAQVGPYACIGQNAIIDENASVQHSIVLPGTMVGSNTSLNNVTVDGGLLLDAKRGCRVAITDSFILSDISEQLTSPGFLERIVALFLFCLVTPMAALSRVDWSELEAHDGRGGAMRLKTGNRGRLIVRRWHWLKQVVIGRMRLVGILPRSLDWSSETADSDVARRLATVPPGVIALSDMHDCHSPLDPTEWIHASYQALCDDKSISKLVRSSLLRLAFKPIR
ncbi:hypothetical protein [Pelagicoccus albus]|uniref:Mannose-1-phosphate guanyltransferase C-terminal domain-containing protein n=1 Tax=Pelagicoccus albus TaxID=415222 RepID=A0A7X1B6N7_9BACT|nr:hypothetical protein [Pelagicoccus albus]MBC2606527.1 hypothetical protein [Pelagicoccus albus]